MALGVDKYMCQRVVVRAIRVVEWDAGCHCSSAVVLFHHLEVNSNCSTVVIVVHDVV